MRCVLVLVLALLGCQTTPVVRVGAKSFAEQQILAELIVARLSQAGIAAQVVECGDTYACQSELRNDGLDVMVEYTGTGLSFAGGPPDGDLADLRALYAPFGVEWLAPLGFDNSYAVVARADRPWRTIDDLARGTVRVAAPREYLRRPRDGLNALKSRYGLEIDVVVIDGAGDRYAALGAGKADVAIGYGTDGAIADLGLRVLTDTQRFFPPYDAVLVVRKSASKAMRAALKPLAGMVDVPRMRAANAAVQIGGADPAVVARRMLVERKLLDAKEVVDRRPVLRVTMHVADDLAPYVRKARDAVRVAFPDRPVVVQAHAEPARRVRRGNARVAVVGAERFFRRARRDERLEAVAVLGTRAVHVVRRCCEDGAPLDGRVGAPPSESGAGRIADAVLASPASRASVSDLLQAVRDKQLDGAVVVAELGDPRIAKAFAEPGLELRALTVGPELHQPYMRRARIRAGTYANQAAAVDTVEVQVLLAGPRAGVPGGGGPAAALPTSVTPLTTAEVAALSEATGVPEAPDPAVPSAWQRRPVKAPGGGGGPLDVVLNLFAVAFTIWLVRAVMRREEEPVT